MKTDFFDFSRFNKNVCGYDDGWILKDSHEDNRIGVLVQNKLSNEEMDTNWSADLEETHEESAENSWIDVYERERVLETISLYLKGTYGMRVVEFGSSDGYMIRDIRDSFPNNDYIATDLYAEGLNKSYNRNPDIMHIQCDNIDAPFKNEVMDLVVSLNVLEHIEDDEKAISEYYRISKRGGHSILVVPRGVGLYDYYDEALYHKRRYDDGELARKCRSVGFRVIYDNHLASLIYPAFWVKKKWNRHQWKKGLTYKMSMEKTERDINKAGYSKVATVISSIEGRLYKKINFRHGIREIVVCVKEG